MSKHHLSIVILAAGQGTRMRSARPKVLQPLAGRPLLAHVIGTARELEPAAIHVVYGHGGEQVPQALANEAVNWVEQAEQLGTGHAVQQVLPALPDDHTVLVLYGDVPLMRAATLRQLTQAADNTLALLTAQAADPAGYGRIVRTGGQVQRIVEHKDASEQERGITEINTGLLACPATHLRKWLAAVRNDNAQREYYLTDIVALAVQDGVPVTGIVADDYDEVHGINDRAQLAHAEHLYRQRQSAMLLTAGVTLIDPARIDVRGSLQCGQDVVIDINTVFEGDVQLGSNVRIGPHCVIRDSAIADNAEIFSHCVIDNAAIGKDCQIGPFARLRPGTKLAEQARIGNFVELKNTDFGAGSKANHLAYLGDATIGRDVNIGCGTITCNYDGANKHRTIIEDGVFIGSDTQLIAPVTVGKGATIGAGTTLTKDAPPEELTLSRAKQVTVPGWKRPVKKKS